MPYPGDSVQNIGFEASAGKLVIVDTLTRSQICQISTGDSGGFDFNKTVTGVARSYKIARGTVAATASKVIATGLTAVVTYALSMRSSRATTANYASAVTGYFAAANLTAYRWKHKSATNSTLVAATSAGTLDWIAVGT
jgi:hypothetical protein